jgi:alcohol dehydrogenase (cytochrome c)
LSTKNGRPVWDRAIAQNKNEIGFVGHGWSAGRERQGDGRRRRHLPAGGNFIAGLDAKTGEPAWRVYTVGTARSAGRQQLGTACRSRSETAPSVWVAGSYDPTLNLAFFGTGQTYDTGSAADSGERSERDARRALHRLDAGDRSRLAASWVWHFQHQPNDQWDLDWALEQILFKLPGTQKTLLATCRQASDLRRPRADSGKYVFSMDLGLQDVVTAIDPTTARRRSIRRRFRPRQDGHGLPALGRREIVDSRNRSTALEDAVFVPLNEACMDLLPVPGRRSGRCCRRACGGACGQRPTATASTAACRRSTSRREGGLDDAPASAARHRHAGDRRRRRVRRQPRPRVRAYDDANGGSCGAFD